MRLTSRDAYGYVPYPIVLQAAIANAFGNKSLFDSKYEAFKKVSLKSIDTQLDILKSQIKPSKEKNPLEILKDLCKNYSNPLYQILYIRLALITWKR